MLCCILPPWSTWRLGIKKPQAIQPLENKDVRRLYRDWCCYYRRSLAVDCGSKQFVNFHHKTAFDIPGAKNVTLFSKILNCKFLVLCFVLCWSRCVMVSCTRKRKCDGQLGPCHIYAMFRRSCTHFYQWVWPCVHNKTIKNEFMNSTTTNTGAHSPCAGLKITDSRSPVMMTGQIIFWPDKPGFWPVK